MQQSRTLAGPVAECRRPAIFSPYLCVSLEKRALRVLGRESRGDFPTMRHL